MHSISLSKWTTKAKKEEGRKVLLRTKSLRVKRRNRSQKHYIRVNNYINAENVALFLLKKERGRKRKNYKRNEETSSGVIFNYPSTPLFLLKFSEFFFI